MELLYVYNNDNNIIVVLIETGSQYLKVALFLP